jgi:tripartite-type tricarboxylate transporter receptor subunit TctC
MSLLRLFQVALRHLLFASFVVAAGFAAAQGYPDKPVKIIVPFPPGGGTDVLGRIIGEKLGNDMKQPFVIENRPGAAGVLGASVVSQSPPDGYTLLMTALGGITPANIDAFQSVILVAAPPNVVVVHPSVKAENMKEFLALARAQPGKLNYGSSGQGSLSHLAGELLKSMAKVEIVHVPYKGMGQVLSDLVGGHVQFAIAPLAAVEPHIKAGKMRAIGVTSAKRYAALPDVPTVAESGVPGYEAINWFGLLAPAGVDRAIVASLNTEINRILAMTDVRDRLGKIGADPVGGSAEEFARYIRADTAKWDGVMKAAGITTN